MVTSITTLRSDACRLRALAERLEETAATLAKEFQGAEVSDALKTISPAKVTMADMASEILSKSDSGMSRNDLLVAFKNHGFTVRSVDSLSSALSRSKKLQCVNGLWNLRDNKQFQTSRDTGGATQERSEPYDTNSV